MSKIKISDEIEYTLRFLTNKFFSIRNIKTNKFIKLVFNINCSEFTTSYRGFNLRRFKYFNLEQVSSKGYSFFMETIYLIHKEGIVIKEIPIFFKDRSKGKSKIPRIELVRTFINLFKLKYIQ